MGSGQGRQHREQRANLASVRLVNAILHRDSQQIAASQGKGSGEQTDPLNIRDRIGAVVALRQNCPCLRRCQWMLRHRHQHRPRCLRLNAGGIDIAAFAGGDCHAAQPAGSRVVRMALENRCFGENAVCDPNPGRQSALPSATPARRTAAEDPQPIPSGISFRISMSRGMTGTPCAPSVPRYVSSSRLLFIEPQMSGLRPVAQRENASCPGCVDLQPKRKCQSDSVESWAQICGGCRQTEPKCIRHRCTPASNSCSTYSAEGSSTCVGRRNRSMSASRPRISEVCNRFPR